MSIGTPVNSAHGPQGEGMGVSASLGRGNPTASCSVIVLVECRDSQPDSLPVSTPTTIAWNDGGEI